MRRLSQRVLVLIGAGLLLAAAACGEVGDNRHTNHWLTALSPTDHSTYFPIDKGAHQGLDCNLCHGAYDSFKGFTCTNCHAHEKTITDAAHVGVTGYTYDSNACYMCHKDGTVRFDLATHQKFFPIGDQTPHNTEACKDCHSDPTRLGEVAYVTCGSCHAHAQDKTDPFHTTNTPDGGAPVGSIYAWGVNTCIQCHVDGRMLLRSEHTPNLTYNGNNVAMGPHMQGARCVDCHLTRDFKQFTCSPCHDPGGFAAESTAACDSNKGSACTDLEKYTYFYK